MDQNGTHTVQIGGNEFVIRRINAFDAWLLFGDLQKELLPAISGLLIAVIDAPKDGASEGEKKADEGKMMADAIRELSARLDGAQLKKWTEKLITPDYVGVSMNGGEPQKLTPQIQALVFEDFTVIPHLLFEILKFNFAKPLAGFLNRIGLDTSKINTATLQKL